MCVYTPAMLHVCVGAPSSELSRLPWLSRLLPCCSFVVQAPPPAPPPPARTRATSRIPAHAPATGSAVAAVAYLRCRTGAMTAGTRGGGSALGNPAHAPVQTTVVCTAGWSCLLGRLLFYCGHDSFGSVYGSECESRGPTIFALAACRDCFSVCRLLLCARAA